MPDGDGGRDVPHAERGAGGRRAAGVDRGRPHRAARRRTAPGSIEQVRALVGDRALRERLGETALRPRERLHLGAHGAREPRRARARGRGRARRAARLDARLGDAQGRRPGRRDAGLQRDRAAVHGAVRAAARRGRLRLAGRADLDLPDPRRARLGAAGRRGAGGRHGHARVGHAAGVHARRVAAGAAARARRRDRVLGAAARADRRPARRSSSRWAAAATLSTGCLWLLLSIERGALQGVHAYREVGWSIVLEAAGGSSPACCWSPSGSA